MRARDALDVRIMNSLLFRQFEARKSWRAHLRASAFCWLAVQLQARRFLRTTLYASIMPSRWPWSCQACGRTSWRKVSQALFQRGEGAIDDGWNLPRRRTKGKVLSGRRALRRPCSHC